MILDALCCNGIAAVTVSALARTELDRDRTAAFAVRRALGHLASGNPAGGLTYLEYAQRLAPLDSGIIFAIGLIRLALGETHATESLELLANRTGRREVLIHLAMACSRFGDSDRAAMELSRSLRANAPEQGVAFVRLANTIANEVGSVGWCGLDNAGQLSIGGRAASLPIADLLILLDGVKWVRRARAGRQEAVRCLYLPAGWETARRLSVTARGNPLIGSPIEIEQVTRVEGLVACPNADGIDGWCWLPGEPETVPEIILGSLNHPEQRLAVRAERRLAPRRGFADFAEPREFTITAAELAAFKGALEARGPHGRALYGSPVRPQAALESARAAATVVKALFPTAGHSMASPNSGREPSIPVANAALRLPPPLAVPQRGIAVIIPVYCGLETTLACLDSVLAARSIDERLVVVVDASPDAELVDRLKAMADTGEIELSLQNVNRGFPATANIGLRMTAGLDAVLLNSDTLVPKGWLSHLRDVVHSADNIGTATPLSNDATIFSYPVMDVPNPRPDMIQVAQIAAMARAANGNTVVDTPTGHGFCMYIRAECLLETGVLREDVFAQGYGEENDFCMRARVFGWRHVGVPGTFVGHGGSQSFTDVKAHLIERNQVTLNRLHVGYDKLVSEWLKADPLATSRRRIDRLRLAQTVGGRPSVLLVSHNRSGGVLRHVRERAALHEESGWRALLLRSGRDASGNLFCRVEHEAGEPTPNLQFNLPTDAEALRELLQEEHVGLVELHHFIGHHETTLRLLRELGCPYDIYIHDYAWFCPRITLTNGSNRYCGEPVASVCTHCVRDHGNHIDEAIAPMSLRDRSAALLRGARAVVAPSLDTARRIERHFEVKALVRAWESDTRSVRLQSPPQHKQRRICVVGAIGLAKGYELLLDVARFVAEHNLPLEFMLVGHSCDDLRLLETGRVSITGRYEEAEVARLIRAQNADFAFLPAQWPETWSYVLSHIWKAALPVVAYDIGAQSERIRATGGGIVLPLDIPVGKLAERFMDPLLFSGLEARNVLDVGGIKAQAVTS